MTNIHLSASWLGYHVTGLSHPSAFFPYGLCLLDFWVEITPFFLDWFLPGLQEKQLAIHWPGHSADKWPVIFSWKKIIHNWKPWILETYLLLHWCLEQLYLWDSFLCTEDWDSRALFTVSFYTGVSFQHWHEAIIPILHHCFKKNRNWGCTTQGSLILLLFHLLCSL